MPASTPAGTVYTTSYYDNGTKESYAPVYGQSNTSAGGRGLGNEVDATIGARGQLIFGEGGYDEADQAGATTYTFTFTYTDGRSYSGTVIDDGTYGYAVGQSIVTRQGSYSIDGTSAIRTTSVGPVGAVAISVYTDAGGSSFTPYFYRNGTRGRRDRPWLRI